MSQIFYAAGAVVVSRRASTRTMRLNVSAGSQGDLAKQSWQTVCLDRRSEHHYPFRKWISIL